VHCPMGTNSHIDEGAAQDLLDAEKLATMARIAELTGEFDDIVASRADANADDEHDPEGSTIAFERSRVSALLIQARALLAELEAAQVRLASGTYGICDQCGAAIPSDRLFALPTTRTCVGCRATQHRLGEMPEESSVSVRFTGRQSVGVANSH
jgi:DnaK suppressor protein